MQENKGWVCPRCNRVYSHLIGECKKCNELIDTIQENSETLQKAFSMTNTSLNEFRGMCGINPTGDGWGFVLSVKGNFLLVRFICVDIEVN